jgi:hypothetical protein
MFVTPITVLQKKRKERSFELIKNEEVNKHETNLIAIVHFKRRQCRQLELMASAINKEKRTLPSMWHQNGMHSSDAFPS